MTAKDLSKINPRNLQTPSIRLRLIERADLTQTRIWRNLGDVCRWFGDEQPVTVKCHLDWYERYAQKEKDFVFIIETHRGEPVGQISLYDVEAEQAQIGRLVVPPVYRRHGYAHAAIQLVLRIAFEDLGLRRVYLKTKTNNARAFSLYHNCGFILERWTDTYIYMQTVKQQWAI